MTRRVSTKTTAGVSTGGASGLSVSDVQSEMQKVSDWEFLYITEVKASVASVSFEQLDTETYDCFKIVAQSVGSSVNTGGWLNCRLKNGTSDITSSYSYTSDGYSSNYNTGNSDRWRYIQYCENGNSDGSTNFSLEFFMDKDKQHAYVIGHSAQPKSGGYYGYGRTFNGAVSTPSGADGIMFYPSSGSFAPSSPGNATFRIYGRRKRLAV